MKINPTRPLEALIGDNRGICRQILGRVHCCSHPLAAARAVRAKMKPGYMRTIPVALRRGMALCILETLEEYRGTFRAVMSGNL